MAFPELTAFTRHFQDTAADDRPEHLANLERLQELSSYVRAKGLADLARCLEAASQLVGVLANHAGTVDLDEVKRLAEHTLALTEAAIAGLAAAPKAPRPEPEGSGADESTADESEAQGSEVEHGQAEDEAPALDPELQLNHDMVLGTMLVELGHATKEQVQQALRSHRQLGLPIGECLLMTGGVAPDAILETLRIQERLRTGVDFEARRVRAELDRKLREQYAEIAEGLQKPVPVTAGIRLTHETFIGEILLGLGMITNETLEKGMKEHHFTGKRLGDVLLGMGALQEAELEAGLRMQRKLRHVAGL